MRPLALAALIAVVASAGAGLAEPTTHEIDVLAHDEPDDCVADQAPCLAIADAGWSLVSERDELVVNFTNNGTQAHALAIAPGAAAEDDPQPSEAAFLRLAPVDPGDSTRGRAQIPNGTDTAHLFCLDTDASEPCGNLTRNVYPAGSVEEGRQSGPGLGEPDETPLDPGLGLLGLSLAGLAARRR